MEFMRMISDIAAVVILLGLIYLCWLKIKWTFGSNREEDDK